jgi:hypothetical protein
MVLHEESMGMGTGIFKFAALAGSMALLTASFTLPAAAHEYHHHRYHHHYRSAQRPLTVRRHHVVAVARPDPFHGPAAIITGPNEIAATIVSLPFRAVNMVFPPYGNPAVNPLVLIGAPVHAAGQVAELPFYVVGSAFGAPPVYVY